MSIGCRILIVSFLWVMVGCATLNPHLISIGMTMQEFKKQFGDPYRVRTAKLKDGRSIQEWEYFTQGISKARTLIFFNSKEQVAYWQEYRPWSDKPIFNLPSEVYE